MTTFGSIAILVLLTILMAFYVYTPIAVWLDQKHGTRSAEIRKEISNSEWNIRHMRISGSPAGSILQAEQGLAELHARLQAESESESLVSLSVKTGVSYLLIGLAVALAAPALFRATDTWLIFFRFSGAVFFFLGIGFLLAARYEEGGIAIGLLGLAIAFSYLIRIHEVPTPFFDGLFRLIVLLLLIASSVSLGIWVSHFDWRIFHQPSSEKPIIVVITVLTTLIEFVAAVFGLWQAFAR